MDSVLNERLKGRIPLELGTELRGKNGNYVIKELINCGGNALIYRAENPDDSDDEVVIKETYSAIMGLIRKGKKITSDFEDIQKDFDYAVGRSKKEFETIKSLTIKKGGPYTDYVQEPIDNFFDEDNNTFYLVFKYKNYQPLPKKVDLLRGLKIIQRILEALEDIHETTLHLDISPGNILQSNANPDGNPLLRIIDFGSAYTLEEIQSKEMELKFTNSGTFTAPELKKKSKNIERKRISYAADIYSVGKLLCYLIDVEIDDKEDEGKRKIEREDVCAEGINRAAIRLANELVMKAIDSTPEMRYSSAAEMKRIVCEAIDKTKKIKLAFSKVQEDSMKQFSDWEKRNDKLYGLLHENDEYIPMKFKNGDVEYHINNFLTELAQKDCPHAILTGEGGMGKTTTCMMILDIYKNQKNQIIYIPLRNYRAKGDIAPNTLKKSIMEAFDVDNDDDYEYLINEEDVILLLDGVNEITKYENKFAFFMELAELTNRKYIQILMTSRAQSEGNDYVIRAFNRLTFEPITNMFIDQWLEQRSLKSKNESLSMELYDILGNPMLLRMYAINIIEERRYVNTIDMNFLDNPTTAGEIIWNFLEYQVLESKNLYEDTKENEGLGKIVFRYLLPYIAYQVERREKDNNTFTLVDLKCYIKTFETHFKKNCDKSDDFSAVEPSFGNFFKQKDRAMNLLKLCGEKLSIITKINEYTYEFAHQHFRDIFSATHIMNQMKLKDKSVFTERIFPFHISKMLLEILQEHKYIKLESNHKC